MATEKAKNGKPELFVPKDLPEGYERLDDDFGEVWEPEKIGESIRGVFLGISYVPSDRGRRPFVTHRIRTDEGVRSVASAVLERRMERIPNETPVVLVYQGMIKARKGNTRSFDVYYPSNTRLKAPKPPDLGDEYDRA